MQASDAPQNLSIPKIWVKNPPSEGRLLGQPNFFVNHFSWKHEISAHFHLISLSFSSEDKELFPPKKNSMAARLSKKHTDVATKHEK